jgi:hypothetical protein
MTLANESHAWRSAGLAPTLAALCLGLVCPLPALLAAPVANPAPAAPAAADPRIEVRKKVESLAVLSGQWSCQGTFSNGSPIASRIAFTPEAEGAWLLVHHDDLPPNQFHALEVWGFDDKAQQLAATFYDNFGGLRRFTSPGWNGQKLIWTGDTSNAQPPVTQRFVFQLDAPGQLVVTWEVKKGAADWIAGDTLTCKK